MFAEANADTTNPAEFSTHPQRPEDVEPERGSRRLFLRGAATAVAAAGTGVLAAPALAQSTTAGAQEFRDIQRHENAHVAFLVMALGTNARPKPRFQNLRAPGIAQFMMMAQTFENVGCGAYTGAAPSIVDPNNLAAAGSIALIEGRHAGWLNTFLGGRITQNVFGDEQNFERPLSAAEVQQLAGPFIADLNGGPPLTYTRGNDVSVLNFALALEYLEAEFYNLNVPRFFRG